MYIGDLTDHRYTGIDAAGFNLSGEAYVQYGVVLGVWGFSGIGEATQEVGHHNCSS